MSSCDSSPKLLNSQYSNFLFHFGLILNILGKVLRNGRIFFVLIAIPDGFIFSVPIRVSFATTDVRTRANSLRSYNSRDGQNGAGDTTQSPTAIPVQYCLRHVRLNCVHLHVCLFTRCSSLTQPRMIMVSLNKNKTMHRLNEKAIEVKRIRFLIFYGQLSN